MVMLGAEAVFYEGMRTPHTLYFCLHKILAIHEQTVDMENEEYCLFW